MFWADNARAMSKVFNFENGPTMPCSAGTNYTREGESFLAAQSGARATYDGVVIVHIAPGGGLSVVG